RQRGERRSDLLERKRLGHEMSPCLFCLAETPACGLLAPATDGRGPLGRAAPGASLRQLARNDAREGAAGALCGRKPRELDEAMRWHRWTRPGARRGERRIIDALESRAPGQRERRGA